MNVIKEMKEMHPETIAWFEGNMLEQLKRVDQLQRAHSAAKDLRALVKEFEV